MDDIGSLIAKLALRTAQITPQQYERVQTVYAESGGKKPIGAILLERGLLSGGALTNLLNEHQRRLSHSIERVFTQRIIEQKYASDDTLRECRTAIEDMRSRGFDFDLLELLLKRNAITQEQASELRKFLLNQVLLCPICLRTEQRNGQQSPTVCPDCKEPYSNGASNRFLDIGAATSHAKSDKDSYPEQLGAYKIIREIGRGGMAVVFEAADKTTGKRVALKVLRSNVTLDHAYLARFHSEAETLERLDHPNIVRIYGIGESNGYHFYAMDYVDGQGLDKMIHECKLNLRRTLAWIRDIARALQTAHDQHIVHRDVKPGNIMVDSKGRVFLTDFGLASRERSNQVTVSGTTVGTPNFMSPEQARGERSKIDQRTDVYSLGTTLYNLCTGRVPYRGNTPEMVIQQILNEEPKRPSLINYDINPALETIILRAMDKDMEKRFFSAGAMADDIDRWLGGGQIVAAPKSTLEKASKWWVRHGLIASMLLGAGIVGFSAAYFMLIMERGSSRSELEKQQKALKKLTEENDEMVKTQREIRGEHAAAAERLKVEMEVAHAEALKNAEEKYKNRYEDAVRHSKLIEDGILDERCERVIAVLRSVRDNANGLELLGSDLLRRGEYGAAYFILQRGREEFNRLPDYASNISEQMQARVRPRPDYRELIDIAKNLSALNLKMAEASSWGVWSRWIAVRDTPAAMSSITKTIAEFPGVADPLYIRALLSLRTDHLAEANLDFDEVNKLDATDPRGRLGLAEVKMVAGRLGDARSMLEKIPRDRPLPPDFYVIEGHCLEGLGRYNDALQLVETPAEIRNLPDILAIRCRCLFDQGAYKYAYGLTQTALKAYKDAQLSENRSSRLITGRTFLVYQVWATAAESAIEIDMKKEAVEAANEALKIRPNDAVMLKVLKRATEEPPK